MTLLKKISMNKNMKDVELCVCDTTKNGKALALCHKNGQRLIVADFKSVLQLRRFLCEAVLMRVACADETTIDRVRSIHQKICASFIDVEKRHDEIIH